MNVRMLNELPNGPASAYRKFKMKTIICRDHLLILTFALLTISCGGQPTSSGDDVNELAPAEQSILKSTTLGINQLDDALVLAKNNPPTNLPMPSNLVRIVELLKPCSIKISKVKEDSLQPPANMWEIIEANGNNCPVDIKHRHHFVVSGTTSRTTRNYQFDFSYSVKNPNSEFAVLNEVTGFSLRGHMNSTEGRTPDFKEQNGLLSGVFTTRSYGEASFRRQSRIAAEPIRNFFLVDISNRLRFPGRFEAFGLIKNSNESLLYTLNGKQLTAEQFENFIPNFR